MTGRRASDDEAVMALRRSHARVDRIIQDLLQELREVRAERTKLELENLRLREALTHAQGEPNAHAPCS